MLAREGACQLTASMATFASWLVQTNDAAMRGKVNSLMKYGDGSYVKPADGKPLKNLLEDRAILCAGQGFSEFRWQTNKDYLGNLPPDTAGCMQAMMLSLGAAHMTYNTVVQPLLRSAGRNDNPAK